MGETTSILTNGQREYLRGETTPSQERTTLTRMRRRVYSGIHDGTLIWQHLPVDEREKIFDMWREDDPTDEAWGTLSEGDRRRQDRFRHALTCWLATLYAGVEGNNDLGFGFEDVLGDAVASAVHARGDVVDEFEFTVETRDSFDTEALLERFERGDPHLSMLEIQHLRDEADVDGDDMSAYRDRMTGGATSGFVGAIDPEELLEESDEIDSGDDPDA